MSSTGAPAAIASLAPSTAPAMGGELKGFEAQGQSGCLQQLRDTIIREAEERIVKQAPANQRRKQSMKMRADHHHLLLRAPLGNMQENDNLRIGVKDHIARHQRQRFAHAKHASMAQQSKCSKGDFIEAQAKRRDSLVHGCWHRRRLPDWKRGTPGLNRLQSNFVALVRCDLVEGRKEDNAM